MQLPKDVEPQNWDRGPMFSSFQSGYITGTEHRHFNSPLDAVQCSSSCKPRAGLQWGTQTRGRLQI